MPTIQQILFESLGRRSIHHRRETRTRQRAI